MRLTENEPQAKDNEQDQDQFAKKHGVDARAQQKAGQEPQNGPGNGQQDVLPDGLRDVAADGVHGQDYQAIDEEEALQITLELIRRPGAAVAINDDRRPTGVVGAAQDACGKTKEIGPCFAGQFGQAWREQGIKCVSDDDDA